MLIRITEEQSICNTGTNTEQDTHARTRITRVTRGRRMAGTNETTNSNTEIYNPSNTTIYSTCTYIYTCTNTAMGLATSASPEAEEGRPAPHKSSGKKQKSRQLNGKHSPASLPRRNRGRLGKFVEKRIRRKDERD